MPRRRLPQDPIRELLQVVEDHGGRYPRPPYAPLWTEDLLASGARYELPAATFNLYVRLLAEQGMTGWLPSDVAELAGRVGMPREDLEPELRRLRPWFTDLGDGRILNPRMAGECVLSIRLSLNQARRAKGRQGTAVRTAVGTGVPPVVPPHVPPHVPPTPRVKDSRKDTPQGVSKRPDSGQGADPGAAAPVTDAKASAGAQVLKGYAKNTTQADLDLAHELAQLIVESGTRPSAKPSKASVAGFGRLRRRLEREGGKATAVDRIRRVMRWVFLEYASPPPAKGYSHRRTLLSGDSWAAKPRSGDGHRFDSVEAECLEDQRHRPMAATAKRDQEAQAARQSSDACLAALRLAVAAGGPGAAQVALQTNEPAKAALARYGGAERLLDDVRRCSTDDEKRDLAARWRRAWQVGGRVSSRLPGADQLAQQLAAPQDDLDRRT